MKTETILTMLLIIICLGAGFVVGALFRNEECKSCQMYNNTFGVTGLNFPNEYYCVWTKGRTVNQIASTEEHEICHALTDKDYYHFCEEYK